MAEVENGGLILLKKHHGETHVKIVALEALVAWNKSDRGNAEWPGASFYLPYRPWRAGVG